MSQNIIFSNKKFGKITTNLADLLAWKSYTDNVEPERQFTTEIQQQHPPEPTKRRGRPRKILFPPVLPEPEPEPEPESEPEPEQQFEPPKRKVGRPKKALTIITHA